VLEAAAMSGVRAHLRSWLLAAAASALLLCGTARAAVVERVVAVVGDKAILLSELQERARPFLLRIYREAPPGPSRTVAVSQMYKLLLDRMVDEELELAAASRARITITGDEVEQALGRVAAQNGVSVERLVAEAEKSGMTEAEYRREIRRQLLDAKMMSLRIQGRIRIGDDDLHALYQQIVLEERRRLAFSASWIVLSAPRSASGGKLRERRALAERLVREARAGADFSTLAREHSDDSATRVRGGRLGRLAYGQLAPRLDQALLALEPGQVSAPVRDGDRFVVLRLDERQKSALPSFEEAAEELQQRVYMEKMAKTRQHWLDSLRRQTHVEIRL
jgi:peptidyl-prolyl cis-trans isomerase SurA